MADNAYDAIAKVLVELQGRFGANVFSDRRRVVSVLSDRVPEARREIRVIGSCIDEGIFDSLSSTRPDQVVFEIDRLAARIEGNLGVRKDIALPVVRACAHGLGRGPLPSAYASSPGEMPQTPTADSGDGWVGVSEPVRRPPGVSQPGTQQGSWVNPASAYPTSGAPSQGAYGQPIQGYPSAPVSQGTQGQPNAGYIPAGSQAPTGTYAPPGSRGVAAAGSGRRNMIILAAIGGVLLLLVALYLGGKMLGGGKDDSKDKPPPPPIGRVYGEETRDFGVTPQATLQTNINSPTPNAIPVGKIISTVLLEEEIRKGTQFLLVDVLEGQHPQTIVKARYISYGGRGGSFNDQVQTALANELNQLTNGRKDFPIVFFCFGVQCWESYNAVLRAWNAGYRNVYWYRGGLTAWQQAGFPMNPTPASR
jgi:PQQ-dependent catabolism-associated CXXCW motif protein